MEEPEVARAAVGEAVLVVAEVLLAEAPSHDPIPPHHAGAPRARHRRRAGSTAAAQRMPLVKEFRHGVSKTRLRCGGPVPPLVVLLAGYDWPGVVEALRVEPPARNRCQMVRKRGMMM